MKTFLHWWLIFCLSVFGLIVAALFGGIKYVANADATKISFIIVAAYMLASGFIGKLTHDSKKSIEFVKHLPFCWFTTELMLGLGMIGTLIGFLLLLQVAFGSQIDLSNAASTQKILSSMAVGFATSGLTTLIGLGASLLLKIQLVNLEYNLPEEQK